MRDHRDRTVPAFGVVLARPVSLCLMTALVLADVAVATGAAGDGPDGGRVLDLRVHDYAQTRWFFGAGAVWTRRPAYHVAFALLAAAAYVAYVALLFAQLR